MIMKKVSGDRLMIVVADRWCHRLRRKKRQIPFTIHCPLQKEREFAQMVISPHARFTGWDTLPVGNMIPSVRAMINGMKEEAVVGRVQRQIRFGKEGFADRQARVPIALGRSVCAFGKKMAKAQKSLRGNRRGGAVDWLVIIPWIGRARQIIAQPMQVRCA